MKKFNDEPQHKRQEKYHDDQPEGYRFLTNTDKPEGYRRKPEFIITEGAFFADGTPWPSGWTVWVKRGNGD